MAVPIKKLTVSLIKRNAIRRGPTSSDAWNDSFEEVVNDLSRLTTQWNDSLYPLLITLPDGTNDLDAFTNGLDGRTIYVDHSATSTVSNTTYFNIADDRPNNIKEQFSDVYTTITQLQTNLESQITNAAGALTDAQKARIGINIFDSLSASSSTSLDGKSENNRLNLIQVARDLYGPGFSLDNDGAANLTNSLMVMVDALLELHNGNWDNDVSISHSGVGGAGDFLADGSVPMTGTLKLANGTAPVPSLTFDSDQNTGLFRAADNQLGVATGSVEVARFTTSGLRVDNIGANLTSEIHFVTASGTTLSIANQEVEAVGTFITEAERKGIIVATADYIVDNAVTFDRYILVKRASGAITTVTLPDPPQDGRILTVKDARGDANSFNITVDPGSLTIDGDVLFVMNSNYQSNDFIFSSITGEWSAM